MAAPFHEQECLAGHWQTGWEMTQVEAGTSLLLDGEDLDAKTAPRGLEV